MYRNSKNIDCKKNPRRTPSKSFPKRKRIEIELFKETTDADLYEGLEVCYKDIGGIYSKLGIITDTEEQDGVKLYLLNTSFGSFAAEELKLIKHH